MRTCAAQLVGEAPYHGQPESCGCFDVERVGHARSGIRDAHAVEAIDGIDRDRQSAGLAAREYVEDEEGRWKAGKRQHPGSEPAALAWFQMKMHDQADAEEWEVQAGLFL